MRGGVSSSEGFSVLLLLHLTPNPVITVATLVLISESPYRDEREIPGEREREIPGETEREIPGEMERETPGSSSR